MICICALLALLASAQGSTAPTYDYGGSGTSGGSDLTGTKEIIRPLTTLDMDSYKAPSIETSQSYPTAGSTQTTANGPDHAVTYKTTDDDRDYESDGIPLTTDERRYLVDRLLAGYLSDDVFENSGYGDSDSGKGALVQANAEAIIADILRGGFTTPDLEDDGHETSKDSQESEESEKEDDDDKDDSSVVSTLDLAQKQFATAMHAYSMAQARAQEAERNFEKAKAAASVSGGEISATAVAKARAEAVTTISTARAEARANVLFARQNYGNAISATHTQVTIMKALEKKMRTLLVAFAKARMEASSAIRETRSEAAKRRSYSGYTGAKTSSSYPTIVSHAKDCVNKMKGIEKKLIAYAKAYAKARISAAETVHKVRRAAITMAQTCAAASTTVSASVKLATKSVAQAIASARATSEATVKATASAAAMVKDNAQATLHVAALAVAEARAHVQAIAAAKEDDEDDSYGSRTTNGGYSGSTGGSGYSSNSGYSGSTDSSGYSGSTDSSGYTGSNSYSGSTGGSGYTGSNSYSGSTEDSGYTGSNSYSGSTGDSGYSGSSGYSGTSSYDSGSGTKPSGTSTYTGGQDYSSPSTKTGTSMANPADYQCQRDQ